MRASPGAGHPVSGREWPPSASTGRGVEVMATALEGASVTGQAGGVSAALAGPATRQAAAPANRIAPERSKERVRLLVPPVHVRGSSGERAACSAARGGRQGARTHGGRGQWGGGGGR